MTSNRIKSRFFCDILVAFFLKVECNEEKCRSEYANFITNLKYKIIFTAFCITENLKDSSFYENFKLS